MRMHLFMMAALTTAACTAPSSTNTMSADSANMLGVDDARPSEASGDAFAVYAGCSSTLAAMARLYDALATRESGANRDDMVSKARARDSAAAAFRTMAVDAASATGKTEADVDRIRAARDAEYERASLTQPFDQFAGALARDADACKIPPS